MKKLPLRHPALLTALIFSVALPVCFLTLLPNVLAEPQSQMTPNPTSDRPDLKEKLTPEQYRVAVLCGTEPPFRNAYWNNKEPGIYVCVISGKPLFTSLDKFDSGTGWPSFTKPVDKSIIEEVEDRSHGMNRVEVRSAPGDSHLGHVFPDGPGPEGLRYCINSASLRFIPAADLEKEGYPEFVSLFAGGEKKTEE